MSAVASPDKILYRLREMFGEDRAVAAAGDDFRVDDEPSRVVAFPHNVEELSEMMKLANDERWRIIPAGAGTWLEMGNRPRQFHLIVSTAKMNRVIEYEPADLTATVEAGRRVSSTPIASASANRAVTSGALITRSPCVSNSGAER